MIRRGLLVLFFTIFTSCIFAVGIGLDVGTSFFNYAEVGENNKDDLYSINSILTGINVRHDIGHFNIEGSASIQVPYNIEFTDAFGTDKDNYLEELIFFGMNSQLFFSSGLVFGNIKISMGPVINYDYFYFKDFTVGMENIYTFSILGAGGKMNLDIPLSTKLFLNLGGSFISNFLPLNNRTGNLKWSNNLMIEIGLDYYI